MINKKEILESLATREDRLFVSKILDQAILSLKYYEARYTSYLDPFQQNLILDNLRKISDLGVHLFGGHIDAERKMIAFFPEYITSEELEYPFKVLEVSAKNLTGLNHRDFLGAFLGLGIKREKIGDILINDDSAYVFVINDIAEYIILNIDKVSNTKVHIEEKNIGDIIIPEKKYKEIHSTVASLRLDAVLSVALGCSRAKVLPLIQSEKVNINWKPVTSPSYMLKEGDTISVRGQGRMSLDSIVGLTRKGRVSINIKRFI